MIFDETRFALLEWTLGRLMLAGVLSSAAFLGSGLAMFLAGYEGRGGTASLTLGLIVLMATPVLRVMVAVIEAIRIRDWFFLFTALCVVILLALTAAQALR